MSVPYGQASKGGIPWIISEFLPVAVGLHDLDRSPIECLDIIKFFEKLRSTVLSTGRLIKAPLDTSPQNGSITKGL